MKKILIGVLVLIVVVGTIAYFNPGIFMDLGMKLTSSVKHRDPSKEEVAFTITAADLSNEFKANNQSANSKYIDKSILLSGKITNIALPVISLDNIACTLDSAEVSKANVLKIGDDIKIQGQFIGYNELMEEIEFTKCGIK